MLASIIHLILLLVATANGKPAEPMESLSGISRESRQLIMLPYHGRWPADGLLMPQHGSYHQQHDYGYSFDSLMDTVHPVTQQRWMDALLAATVSKEKQRPLLDISKSSGHLNSTNLNPSASQKNSSRFTSKNTGTGSPSSTDLNFIRPQQQHEFIQLEPRPDIQGFFNQTIQMIITAVVQAILAQLAG